MLRMWIFLPILCITACATPWPSAEQRGLRMDATASANYWKKLRLPAGKTILTAYVPNQQETSKILTIYIEGDGLAWLNRAVPSDDPTPNNPLGLKLALRHPDNAVAYLARPCQNIDPADRAYCKEEYWTRRRFSPENVEASAQAIDSLKARASAEELILVGYSGGGAIAALVAAKRRDVVQLITVAGNLDTKAWTSLHRVEALSGSLNPADYWEKLQRIPQLHFVGGKDQIIPQTIAEAYASRFPRDAKPESRLIAEFDHICCWAEDWPELLGKARLR